MPGFDEQDSKRVKERVRASLLMLAFGLGTLAFLIGIDRAEWFVLRPASGTAAAMSMASDVSARDHHAQH